MESIDNILDSMTALKRAMLFSDKVAGYEISTAAQVSVSASTKYRWLYQRSSQRVQ